jgi:hypothetical protein
MAIGVITEVDDGTLEQYDRVHEKIAAGPPADGLVCHIAAVKKDGGFRIIEVWESEEQLQRFNQEVVGPAVSEVVGPDSRPSSEEIFEVHNLIVAGREG